MNTLRTLTNYFLHSAATKHIALQNKHPRTPTNSSSAKHAVTNLPSSSNTLQLKLVGLGCDSPSPLPTANG